MIEHALRYATHGWAVFPCQPRGKTPCGHLAPHGVKDATTNTDQIHAWWDAEPQANIGLATGRESGVIVIDLDGDRAEDAYGRLLAAHGPPGEPWCTDGASVRTGSGWHLYLRPPKLVDIRNSASKIAPGIDIRGEGGYVIAPPSIHPTGRRYIWRDPIPDRGLPLLSPTWVRLLNPPTRTRTTRPSRRAAADHDGTRYGLAALHGECNKVRGTAEGGRNHALNEAAFAAGTLIASGDLNAHHAIDELAAAAEDAGLPQREADKTIASGIRAGRAHPRDRAA